MNEAYKEKSRLLLQVLPIVMDEPCFALHGGSAINLYVTDLPRLSVDADITYIPLEDRPTSLAHINEARHYWWRTDYDATLLQSAGIVRL